VVPPGFAALFGAERATTASDLLRSCVPQVFRGPAELEEPLRIALEVGTLSERLVAALGPRPAAEQPRRVLAGLLERLANGLLEGRSFVP
jgi:hypothetical protein